MRYWTAFSPVRIFRRICWKTCREVCLSEDMITADGNAISAAIGLARMSCGRPLRKCMSLLAKKRGDLSVPSLTISMNRSGSMKRSGRHHSVPLLLRHLQTSTILRHVIEQRQDRGRQDRGLSPVLVPCLVPESHLTILVSFAILFLWNNYGRIMDVLWMTSDTSRIYQTIMRRDE